MADAATLPQPSGEVCLLAATLSLAPLAARFVLRTRGAAALAAVTGLELPTRIGETRGGIAMLGPDEWYIVLPSATPVPQPAGLPLSLVDVSARAIGFIVEGPGAAAVVMAGCPLDVARMPVGRASRTVFETVEIILFREADTRFRIEVWRSFAPWLWAALAAAG